jgi:hypothetical protein
MGMMLVGASLCVLAWIYVRYHGVNGQRVLVFACGSALFILGMMRVMVELHPLAFGI